MNYFITCLAGCMFLLGIGPTAQAQVTLSTVATNAGGNSFQDDQILMEWSIGEMVAVNTSIEPTLIVSKGVLQPQRIRTANSENNFDLKLYPTITSGNNFWITARISQPFTVQAIVYNPAGQLLSKSTISASPFYPVTGITLPLASRAEYFVEIRILASDNSSITKKTFRIQKV